MSNEKKSAEYVPPGPVAVGTHTRMKVVDDPETVRLKAAHAARMAPPPEPEPVIASPAAVAIAALPRPKSWDAASTGRTSSAAPNLSAGSPPIQHAAYDALAEELKMTSDNVRGLIVRETRALEAMLLEKNARYGNSALEPLNVFSKLPAVQGILVRLDDKLKRIKNMGLDTADEDTVEDLIGYLILLRVARRLGLD